MLERDPGDTKALAARAVAHFAERNFEESMADAQRLCELQPQSLRWWQLQLEILRGQGEPARVMIEHCDRWIEAGDADGRFHMLKAGLLANSGRMDQARQWLDEAATLGAESLDVLQVMVAMLDELQLHETARAVMDGAKQRFPDQQWVRQAIIHRHWQAGRLDQGLAEVTSARADFPAPEAGVLRLEAMLLAATGQRDAATRLRSATSCWPRGRRRWRPGSP
jgi:tetratricopeptide (TPR) repeat protein